MLYFDMNMDTLMSNKMIPRKSFEKTTLWTKSGDSFITEKGWWLLWSESGDSFITEKGWWLLWSDSCGSFITEKGWWLLC
jgi:hypothetical protein